MKRKNLFLLLVPILITFGGLGYYLNETFNTTYGVWNINWGFEVPKPSKITTVFENFGGFLGDGDAYIIVDYNNDKRFEKAKNQAFWKRIDKKSLDIVSERISQFQKNTADVHFEKADHYSKLFSDYPVKYGEGDLYFYKVKEDGSFFIAIFNVENHRIYTMEWVQ
jgi:hypothetical protein